MFTFHGFGITFGQSWQVHLQGVRQFHGSDYKQSNAFKIILWGFSLNGKCKYCFIKKMLKLQIREYGMKKQWLWHGSSCRKNEPDQGWSQLAFCGFIRDVTWVYIRICEKSFTMALLLRVNDPQLDLPMEWVLYSSLSLKNLFKNKSTLLAFSSFEETKVWVPFVRVKRKGILVSPLRPLPIDKNGLCTFP